MRRRYEIKVNMTSFLKYISGKYSNIQAAVRKDCEPSCITINSIFYQIFRNKGYLLQLYRAIHPEDSYIAENKIKNITVRSILTDDLYNELSFLAGKRLIILLEIRYSIIYNIVVRALVHLTEIYREYFENTSQSLYRNRKIIIPKPELYLICTGDQKDVPDVIELSKEFFGYTNSDVDVKAKFLYENDTDSIISQYINFCKIYREQMKLYGKEKKTITETIRICESKDILKEYFLNREEEIISVMMNLFDEERIMESYIKSEQQEAVREEDKNIAIRLIEMGKMSLDDISVAVKLPLDEVKKLELEVKQLV